MKISVLLVLATASTTWAATPRLLPPKSDQELARDILRERRVHLSADEGVLSQASLRKAHLATL